jgi:8-oxo-dGTP pyrophosphatase MutT (NUDIX family)
VSLADPALRAVLTALQAVRRGFWFIRRPKTFGAHAIALTPERKVVLVKLRYAPGWRVPGGGRRQDEDPVEAALRELREEIGMTAHGNARLASDFEELVDFKHDKASLVLVRDVHYRPRWSLEVEQVREARVDAMPDDLAETSKRWIEAVRPLL